RRADAQALLDATLEIGDLGVARAVVGGVRNTGGLEGVGKREHRDRVRDLGEAAVRTRADGAGRRVDGRELWMREFQRFKFAHQRVVVGIRNRRIVEYVIAVVGVFDAGAQLGDAGGGGGIG